MKNIRLFVITLIFFGIITTAQAQESNGRASFFTVQYQNIDVEDYNAEALLLEQPRLSSNMLGVSLDQFKIKKRWLFTPGFSFFYDLGTDNTKRGSNNLYVISADYGWGYNLLKPNSKWILSPEFLVTIQHHSFKTSSNEASNIIQATMVDHFKMTRWSFPLRFGAQIVRHWADKDGDGDNFVLRIRGGYQLSDAKGWKYNDTVDVEDGGISSQGFYISIGIGSFKAKKNKETDGANL